MKKLIIVLVAVTLFLMNSGQSQTNVNPAVLKKIPSVEIKTLDGKLFNTANIFNDGKPIILSFWATWCKPCLNELTAIDEVYEDWQKETGVKLVAVSIDDSKTTASVRPMVEGKGWEYEVYLDVNGDFKRAMNVVMIPHTFVLNGNKEIVWQHTTYSQGSELKLIETVRKINKGEMPSTE